MDRTQIVACVIVGLCVGGIIGGPREHAITVGTKNFTEQVIRGEIVSRRVMKERNRELRYFRHPFLRVGDELSKRRAFESFLKQRGYVIAPVTVDNDEFVFALA